MAKKQENVNVWDLDGNRFSDPYSVKRPAFYKEQIERHLKGLDPNKRVEVVWLILVDPRNGTIFISNRAPKKQWNGGLLDKTVGGHMQSNLPVELIVAFESLQEIGVACIFPPSGKFVETYRAVRKQLHVSAMVRYVTTRDCILERKLGKESVRIANRGHLFFGAFAGPTHTIDDEAMGVVRYNLEDLRARLTATPHVFTQDLHFLISEFGDQIAEFLKIAI